MSLNTAIFEGRPTTNIEFKTKRNGKEIGVFHLAVNRSYKNKNGQYEADYIPCLINIHSEKQKEYLIKQIKKGKRLICQGELRISMNEKDNRKYQNFTLIINKFYLIDYQTKEKIKEEQDSSIEMPMIDSTDNHYYQPDFDNHSSLSYLS